MLTAMRDGKTAGGRHRVFTTKFDSDREVEEYLAEKVAEGCTILNAQYVRSFEYTSGSIWTITYREPAASRPTGAAPAALLGMAAQMVVGALLGRLATALRPRAS